MRDDLKSEFVVDALAMAVTRRKPPVGVVHHSDRGSQYTSLTFDTTLRESGLVASMGRRGDAYDNAACESVISTIKNELVKRRSPGTSWASRRVLRGRLSSFEIHSTMSRRKPRGWKTGRPQPLGWRTTLCWVRITTQ